MSKKGKQMLVAYGLVIPAFMVVMLTVAYPILAAVIKSFQDSKTGAFTLANYEKLFTGKLYTAAIWYTIWVTVATVVLLTEGSLRRSSAILRYSLEMLP